MKKKLTSTEVDLHGTICGLGQASRLSDDLHSRWLPRPRHDRGKQRKRVDHDIVLVMIPIILASHVSQQLHQPLEDESQTEDRYSWYLSERQNL